MPTKPKSFKPNRLKTKQHKATSFDYMYTRKWRKTRAEFLKLNPLCICKGSEPRCNRIATEVDHIRQHKGNEVLFNDTDNLQAMSKVCHSIKTRRENGAISQVK